MSAFRRSDSAIRSEHFAHVEADDLREAQTGAEREGEDDVVTDGADGRAEDQALLVGRQRSRGEVRHGGLRAAQVPSVGEEVKEMQIRFLPPPQSGTL